MFDRLARAGATPKELAQLEAEQAERALTEQDGWLARFEQMAHGDLVEWLAKIRKAGYFKAKKVDDDTEKVPDKEHTKAELIEQAEAAGIEVPSDATKAEIAELLENPPETTGQEDEGQASQQGSTDAPDAPGADETPVEP
jgi:hypothetical protein